MGCGRGLTRCYLEAHWFTDVVGGRTLSLGWLGLWNGAPALWLPTRWARRTTSPY
ncbi:hypothetical protein ACIPSE_34330 [Streptomyces sp. NPDC090106]|uniref:hypothetical protein n=1 Tax=Streptomyces sp. NPDC090106 TaxID=3365946 RepID=UPI00382F0E5B